MSTIDQQFVEYIVKTLVNNPDKVTVERVTDERGVLLTLIVDPSDTGRVIGRAGATAQSIRMLLRALGTKNQARYNLKITDTERMSQEDEGGRTAEIADQMAENEANEVEDKTVTEEEAVTGGEDTEESMGELANKTRAELADLDDLDI